MSQAAFPILLVEDEPADAHLVRVAFQEAGVNIALHHVLDGVEALEFLNRQPPHEEAPRPCLILLDLNMPRMDGRSFLKTIKADESLRPIPVVVLTTSNAESDMLACYDKSAAGYVVKPLDVDEFLKTIRDIGHYWLSIVSRPVSPEL